MKNQKGFATMELLVVIFIMMLILGEIMCFGRFVSSDFKSPYKREAIYAISFCTGFGGIVGWFDIKE